jgi:hypothetical protein
MMVVVPPFAEPEGAKDEIVSALVACSEGLLAPQMADRVDAPGHVMD